MLSSLLFRIHLVVRKVCKTIPKTFWLSESLLYPIYGRIQFYTHQCHLSLVVSTFLSSTLVADNFFSCDKGSKYAGYVNTVHLCSTVSSLTYICSKSDASKKYFQVHLSTEKQKCENNGQEPFRCCLLIDPLLLSRLRKSLLLNILVLVFKLHMLTLLV